MQIFDQVNTLYANYLSYTQVVW